MEKITGNEPATGYGFTTADGQSHVDEKGLTIRQHFAAMAMQSILGLNLPHPNDENGFLRIADMSVKAADALISELNKPLP